MKLFAHMVLFVLALPAYGSAYFVAPDGRDMNPGTMEKPFATLRRAQEALRQKRGEVFLRGGTYHLSAPLVFNAEDSGTKESPVIFQAYQNEQPVISGGVKLDKLDWQPWTNGIFEAKVPEDLRTEEIFVNGQRQIWRAIPIMIRPRSISTATPPTPFPAIASRAGLIRRVVTFMPCIPTCGAISLGGSRAQTRRAE